MTDRLRKISIIVGSLAAPGGAERIACWLANSWSRQGLEVTLIIFGPTTDSFFELEPSVYVVPVGHAAQESHLLRSSMLWIRLGWKLRRILTKTSPDLLISFIAINNVIALLTSRGLKTKIIVSERSDPHMRRLPFRWEFLRKLTYPWAASVVAQSDHALKFFPEQVRRRGRVIPNPVLSPAGGARRNPSVARRTIMGLGSLRPVKGFDRLIEAFSRIASKHPDWDLVIYGEGPSRPMLEGQVTRLGLGTRVRLPGVTRDSHASLCDSDLFVLCSRSEGFPNALAEAMACGLPVVSFDCNSGPRDLIRNGIDGVLVPEGNVDELAKQIDRLLGDPAERERLAQRATDVVERFSSERVFGLWRQVVREIASPGESNAASGALITSRS